MKIINAILTRVSLALEAWIKSPAGKWWDTHISDRLRGGKRAKRGE